MSQLSYPITKRLHPLTIAIGLAMAGYIPAAVSQVVEDDVAIEESAKGIEVIQVTARHRAESLQSTPIAITAIGEAEIKAAKINGLDDIAARTPGFQMNAYNASEPELFMRGIGSDIESAGAAAAIGMYVDGVYIGRGTAGAMDLFDLASVEVLRGPQGTLYGKNVVGGAINFITKRPTFGEAEGNAELTLGNYGLLEGRAYVTGGLSDKVAGKIAVSGLTRGGYGKNTFTGNDADDLSRHAARAQLLYDAGDAVEMLFTAGMTKSDGTPRVKHIGYSEGRNQAFISHNPREDLNSVDGYEDTDSQEFSLKVDWVNSVGRLTSITAYRSNGYDFFENAATGLVDRSQVFDPWGDPADNTVGSDEELAALQVDDEWLSGKSEDAKQFSQEIRLAGDNGAQLNWIVGAFYMREDIRRSEVVDYWFHTPWGTTAGKLQNTTSSINDSYALFGQMGYRFTDKLSVTSGLRWSRDEKDFSGTAGGRRFDNWDNLHEDINGNRVPEYAFATADSWSSWTPSLSVEYQYSPTVFLYYSLAKGYKSGGFNGEGMEKAEEAVIAFRPETAWNNEIGFKTQNSNNRVRLNGALFHTEYTDIQSQVWISTGPNTPDDLQVMNGSGVAKGLELEATALVTDNVTLNLSYGYLNAKFTKDLLVDDENLNGNKMRRSPEHSINLYAKYHWTIKNLGDASLRVNYQRTSEYFFDNSNDPLTKVGSEFNVDIVASLVSFNDTWNVQLWMKNVTDELNIGSTTLYAAWDDTVFNAYKPPRTFGLTVGYRF